MSTEFSKKIENFLEQMSRERGNRLKSERVRLGFGLSEFATLAGVHRNSQRNYENGTREPDAKYCNAIAKLGVDLLYVFEGATASEWPLRAANIAKFIFERRDVGVTPDAMASLFYLLGSNDDVGLAGLEDAFLSDSQLDRLVNLAFERGDIFSEAVAAVTRYFLDTLSPQAGIPRNCRLWADLIFETIDHHDRLRLSKRLAKRTSLRDGIRIAAEDVKNKHA